MCLVGIAWQSHPEFPLILAANRDEFYARPAAPAAWWEDHPDIYGGRDLKAGGTWLAIARDGRFAAVTNVVGSASLEGNFNSRGHLIRDYLSAGVRPEAYLERVVNRRAAYRPFRIAVGAPDGLFIATSTVSEGFCIDRAEPGVLSLTNAPDHQAWPKATWLEAELRRHSHEAPTDHARLLAILSTERIPEIPDGGLDAEYAFQYLPFIRNAAYGTRASTVVTQTRTGDVTFHEHRFDNTGSPVGRSSINFSISRRDD